MTTFSESNMELVFTTTEVKYVIQVLTTEEDAVWGWKEAGIWQACADVPPWLQYREDVAWEHFISWTAQFPGRQFRLHRTETITRSEAYS